MDTRLATLINPIFTPEAPVVIQTAGAFLIPMESPPQVNSPEFTIFATLSGYERSGGGPITTLFARCCPDCRWPRLSLRHVLTTDPRVITDEYIALAKQGRLYRCPSCGASDITPPRRSGETHRCGYCNRIVELANVHGSEMSNAYETYLRQRSPTEPVSDWLEPQGQRRLPSSASRRPPSSAGWVPRAGAPTRLVSAVFRRR